MFQIATTQESIPATQSVSIFPTPATRLALLENSLLIYWFLEYILLVRCKIISVVVNTDVTCGPWETIAGCFKAWLN